MNCHLCKSLSIPWAHTPDGKAYWRCQLCDLVFMDTKHWPDKDRELSRYLEHKNDLKSGAYLDYLRRLAEPALAGFQGKVKRVLDFGSGPTEGMKALLESRGIEVRSYDPYFFPDRELLKISYEVVLCSEAAEHFFHPGEEFSLFTRMVEAGGVLGVSSQFYPEDNQAFGQWGYRRDPTHVCFYSAKTVRWIADRWGWDVLNINPPIWILRKAD